MKFIPSYIVLAWLLCSCGPGSETTRITELDLRTPSNLERLRPKIDRIIGRDSVAHHYIADYERELEKYLPPERRIELDQPRPLYPIDNLGEDTKGLLIDPKESYSFKEFLQFNKRTLMRSLMDLEKASSSFLQSRDLSYARSGVAAGYVALCSSPNPPQMTIIVNKMLPLIEALQGK